MLCHVMIRFSGPNRGYLGAIFILRKGKGVGGWYS